MAERSAELSALAIQLAHQGASLRGREIFVAGSLSPLEDCYRPDLAPDQASAGAGARRAGALPGGRRRGPDPRRDPQLVREAKRRPRPPRRRVSRSSCRSSRTARDASSRASRSRRPLDALLPLAPGRPRHQLRAGRAPGRGPRGAGGGGSRCARSARTGTWGFRPTARAGRSRTSSRRRPTPRRPARWIGLGARIVGGCCGTTCAHTRALRAAIDAPSAAGEEPEADRAGSEASPGA